MIEFILLFCLFTAVYCLWKNKGPRNFPPGPQPQPFVGNIFQLPTGHLFPKVEEWTKIYGPIIGIRIFDQLVVMVNGVDNIIAALRKEEFQSRPEKFTIRDATFGKPLGIFFSVGEQWASSRKFVVRNLRAFGKNEKEDVITDEITQLLERISDNITVEGTGLFRISAVNVIWKIIANKRIDFNDERSREFLKNLFERFRQGDVTGADIVNIFPILRYVSPKYKFSQRIVKATQNYIRETIQEHREVLDLNSPMDLIDHYLIEVERNKQNPSSLFTEEDLIMIGSDLFSAGAESTSNTIEFVMLYMVLYPEVQEKVQEELDRVLERSRKPVLDDKTKLHYTMAVLNEVQRINTVAPTNVPHCCTKDTTFGGYFIPKNTYIMMNLWALGHDPQYWENPEEFNPERFLDDDGKYSKSPIFHSFGLGQRVCVGEELAKNIIFLFTTTFLEKYSVSLPDGEPKPSTLALPGFTTAPQPFKITIKNRY